MFGGDSGGGSGGNVIWGRKEVGNCKGIAVLFAWVSIPDWHLKNHVDLYSSLGWNSIVCHADFLNVLYPERAMPLAYAVLNELVEELQLRPCPIVFVAFSGASVACMYKVFQVLEGACESQLYLNEYQKVRNCVSGHIYDSTPVDFTSDLGARFALHSMISKFPGTSKVVSWFARGVASGLDALYLTRFDSHRAEYWKTLRAASVDFGAPFLIMCTEEDDLAPYHIILNFTHCIQELGADVKLVKFKGSSHMGHYKNCPIQYRAAVTSLLEKAGSVYFQRILNYKGERMGMEGMHDEMSELICDLQNAAVNSNQSLRRVAQGPSDHFFLPSSIESPSLRESGSLQDEQKERSVYLSNPPSISAHSVLGQFLFDVCVPRNVEGWDIKFSGSRNGKPLASARRHSSFQGMKYIRRSKL